MPSPRCRGPQKCVIYCHPHCRVFPRYGLLIHPLATLSVVGETFDASTVFLMSVVHGLPLVATLLESVGVEMMIVGQFRLSPKLTLLLFF